MRNAHNGDGIRRPAAGALAEEAYPASPRLNERQLAARWVLSVRTLQAARVKGTGAPFVRIGRAIRYRLEDILEYERERLRTSTSERL